MPYRLTRKAAEDITNIYLYGARHLGLNQADAYHALLERTLEFLAAHPQAARKRPELSPPVRIHPFQAHRVIYQIENDGGILIIRVRHAHEDWEGHHAGEHE